MTGSAERLIPPTAASPYRLPLARIIRTQAGGAAESLRIAAELARTLDALAIEDISPSRLEELSVDPEIAAHWQTSLQRFRAISQAWPTELRRRGQIDLAERRNLLLRATAKRWLQQPPAGFTAAAGITTAAPAVAALLAAVAR